MFERVALLQEHGHPFLIHEFRHSVFVIGDHQFLRGYCMLLFKKHVRELHELELAIQSALVTELMIAGRAIADTYGALEDELFLLRQPRSSYSLTFVSTFGFSP